MMRKLNDIPDKNPFKVPESYFEDVTRKILSETSENRHLAIKVSFLNKFRPYIAMAAAVAVFIIISYTTIKILTTKISHNISEVVTAESSELYINDIDISSLEENVASSSDYEGDSGVSDDVIIDYLMRENIELSDIYEHL